eukprot:5746260-Prorocentrum_lima.AAC.1
MERKGKGASQPQCGTVVIYQCCRRESALPQKGRSVGIEKEDKGFLHKYIMPVGQQTFPVHRLSC